MSTQQIYKCLDESSFEGDNGYCIVPLRAEDKYLIMHGVMNNCIIYVR